jgi:hypothetical protein
MMVACVHHIPGRARFKIDALRRDPALAETVRREVSALPGVASVEINRHAASIIVRYCAESGDLSRIMDHICSHCPRAPANRRARAAAAPAPAASGFAAARAIRVSPEMTRAMGEAVGKAVLNTFIRDSVERGLARLFLGLR